MLNGSIRFFGICDFTLDVLGFQVNLCNTVYSKISNKMNEKAFFSKLKAKIKVVR